jgi:DNA-binding MarR family transcriptional regulator
MPSPENVANELLEVVPFVMKEVRSQMRSQRTPDLTVPQFRALAFVNRHSGASLSQVADHMGLTLPSTSRLVDVLIARRFLTREDNPSDRRRIKLGVTNRGQVILENSRSTTLNYLAGKLRGISPKDLESILQGMNVLRGVFMYNATNRNGDEVTCRL